MRKNPSGPRSLRWGLTVAMLICWILPVVVITTVAGVLINDYYEDFFRQTAATSAEHAMRQTELRLLNAMEDSKAVSYDGEVRRAYRSYLEDDDDGALFRSVNEYLSQKFSRNQNFDAVFITFWEPKLDSISYVIDPEAMRYNILQRYRADVEQRAVNCAEGSDARIYYLEDAGELYMVRNILGGNFEPYATLVMLCDRKSLFQALGAVPGITRAAVTLDGIEFNSDLSPETVEIVNGTQLEDLEVNSEADVGGHSLSLRAQVARVSLWGAMPKLRGAIALVVLLILPLLILVVVLFYRHISHPVEVLVRATARVRAGERGYQIEETPRSREFKEIYEHFNRMSTELKSQFERLYLEQQALQQARLKALQSQINPHFLNNTLEIISWEARLAENERVCAMIEALSTMLDAAIGRDGRAQIPLHEEFGYVDAYLYIIKERLGERLTIQKETDAQLMDFSVPRLIVQPLVENAVDHDISARSHSELVIRARRAEEYVYIEVEHDGEASEEDWTRIRALLSAPNPGEIARGSRVGIRNVNQRLKLIYGEGGGLSFSKPRPGRILAKVSIPVNPHGSLDSNCTIINK